ncbi:Dot/Icm T4SS effector LegC3/PpeA [Legionella quateirensis]|uniref:Kinectin 1 n=1 Tax=Legionella quateirensis TaxID=45072 RepID=A0A378KS17_9GAMM|nr:Dot/Icm T4SS effector LegC3/PpeA [Legionella quateirensis]KTD51090.1 kinectin 1 [Legionella quateirensis]STY17664.1 kinectin 1 [Legionella quateirensis]
MLLANFNIPELLTKQIKLYLSDNTPAFSELKTLILSKAPIPQVHSNIVTILTESRYTNLNTVQKALEAQAHKNQLAEDEKQKKQDQSEEIKDEELKKRLNRELKHIPTQISSHETECRILQRKLARLIEAPPQVDVTQKSSSNSDKLQSSTLNEHNRAIEKIRNSILDYEMKIEALLKEQQSSQIRLNEIEKRSEIREIHQGKRTLRTQASIGYRTTGEGIEETLSTKNRNLLAKSIKDQRNAIEKKYADLIQDSEQINFPYFLEELLKYLNSSKPKLTSQEVEALTTILKLMKKHLEFEHQAITTESSLKIKRQFISTQITKLAGLNSKLKSLQESNPNLKSANQKLAAKNLELSISLANYIKLRDRLGNPALLLVALTFAFCIPLILTVSGVIPFFIGPALLYSLVSIPPAALFIATLGVGIAALVYSIKAHMNDSEIKTNLLTIEMNSKHMGRNEQHLKTLETVTIPSLNAQIKKDEIARDNLILSLKSSQTKALQAFNQAKEIEPVAFSESSILDTKVPAPKETKQDSEETDISEHSTDSADSSYEEELEGNSYS